MTTTETDDRYYFALEQDDCQADAMMKEIRRIWRKTHKVCSECDTEDGAHERPCSRYREEEPQLEGYDRRRDDREMARDVTKENDDD